MATEHDYFGIIGDYWAERVDAGDQDVEVVLDADEDVEEASLDVAAAMIGELERLDADVRESFVGELASGGSATSEFLAGLVDQVDAETVDEGIRRESGDRQMDVLRSLDLLRVDLRPDNNGAEEAFAVFEYAFAPDDFDGRLVATLDINGDVVGVEYQD